MELSIVSSVGEDTPVVNLSSLPAGAAISDRDELALRAMEVSAPDAPYLVWSPSEPGASVVKSTVTVKFRLIGSTPDDLAARVVAVGRAVAHPWWLRVVRHGSTRASWIRCQACVPQVTSSVTAVDSPTQAEVVLSATTDPFAYGPRVDVPFACGLAQRFKVDVTGVEGDVLTPAVIVLTPSNDYPGGGWTPPPLEEWAIAVRRDSDGYDPWVTWPGGIYELSGASWAQSADTATITGQKWAATWTGTATATVTIKPTPRRGTYRLWMRAKPGGATFTIRFNGRSVTAAVDGSGKYRMFDLGLVQVPWGQAPMLALPGGERVGASGPTLTVSVDGTSGGVFSLDSLCLLPADDESARLVTSSQDMVLDGYAQTVFDLSSRGTLSPPWSPSPTPINSSVSGGSRLNGGVPRLSPGDNRLWLVKTSGQAACTGTVAYWPRYSWLR